MQDAIFMPLAEASALLGIPREVCIRAIRRGQMPGIRLGTVCGRYYVPREGLEEWLEEVTAATVGAPSPKTVSAAAFVETRCELSPTLRVPRKHLWAEYRRWARCDHCPLLGRSEFYAHLRELDGLEDITCRYRGRLERCFRGIGLERG